MHAEMHGVFVNRQASDESAILRRDHVVPRCSSSDL